MSSCRDQSGLLTGPLQEHSTAVDRVSRSHSVAHGQCHSVAPERNGAQSLNQTVKLSGYQWHQDPSLP